MLISFLSLVKLLLSTDAKPRVFWIPSRDHVELVHEHCGWSKLARDLAFFQPVFTGGPKFRSTFSGAVALRHCIYLYTYIYIIRVRVIVSLLVHFSHAPWSSVVLGRLR